MIRYLPALLLACSGWLAAAPLMADDARLLQRQQALTQGLRCLVCQNETLADSQAQLAVNLRREIHAMLAQGRSEDEVIDFLTQRYGDFILYEPPVKPYTWLLWGGPGLLLAAGTVLWWQLSRRPASASPPLDPAEAARVAALLQQNKTEDHT
ncbi:cytochrome c-type biogenesis protein [Aquitalea aquatica]|uniref:Cytochrome c-type biogenesis protein n=1 Tax=Aquitalea aquatica TaxID=3044273 RepID=A0A838YCB7_9NEIS|nr:cytochrome c-type biogenesis protein [Aquitalea magnusonii]MBA4710137.1 cytochrome c-type biogenesis protein CcmH [Aquitalea magnusonii]